MHWLYLKVLPAEKRIQLRDLLGVAVDNNQFMDGHDTLMMSGERHIRMTGATSTSGLKRGHAKIYLIKLQDNRTDATVASLPSSACM